MSDREKPDTSAETLASVIEYLECHSDISWAAALEAMGVEPGTAWTHCKFDRAVAAIIDALVKERDEARRKGEVSDRRLNALQEELIPPKADGKTHICLYGQAADYGAELVTVLLCGESGDYDGEDLAEVLDALADKLGADE